MMNERLEDLMYLSGMTAQGCWDSMDDYQRQAVEKFAQLIVRECTKSVNDWYQNHDKIHCDPMSYVLAHFGVEE